MRVALTLFCTLYECPCGFTAQCWDNLYWCCHIYTPSDFCCKISQKSPKFKGFYAFSKKNEADYKEKWLRYVLNLGKNDYICTVFIGAQYFICSTFLQRTTTSDKIDERTYKSKEKCPNGVGSPLIYRGCGRPGVGMVVCAVSCTGTLMQISSLTRSINVKQKRIEQ